MTFSNRIGCKISVVNAHCDFPEKCCKKLFLVEYWLFWAWRFVNNGMVQEKSEILSCRIWGNPGGLFCLCSAFLVYVPLPKDCLVVTCCKG